MLTLDQQEVVLLRKILTDQELNSILLSGAAVAPLHRGVAPRQQRQPFGDSKFFKLVGQQERDITCHSSFSVRQRMPLVCSLHFSARRMLYVTGVEFFCRVRETRLVDMLRRPDTGAYQPQEVEADDYQEHILVRISHPENRFQEREVFCTAR